MDEHIEGVADLGVDLYVAGLVHHAEELAEQDRRGRLIALRCATPVVFASFAGPTGGGFDRTAGTSAAWTPTAPSSCAPVLIQATLWFQHRLSHLDRKSAIRLSDPSSTPASSIA